MKPSRTCAFRLITFCSMFGLLLCLYFSSLRLTASAAPLPQAPAATAPTSVEGITAEIVKARGLTSQMVVLANKNYPAGSDKYNRAFTLYAEAYGNYTAWAAYLTASLRAGHAK